MAGLTPVSVPQLSASKEPRLTVISGVGGKLPAMFLIETGNARILLDMGEGPEPGIRPDISSVGSVDAICLSHAHLDHVGSLSLWGTVGSPPVYATTWTWTQIEKARVPHESRRILPLQGMIRIAGTDVQTGRSGHSPGGVWMHFSVGNGMLYLSDWSAESIVFPLDQPPAAGCVITDASYGDRDSRLDEQVSAIVNTVRSGGVLPVPAAGRGPEMAIRLLREGVRPVLCPVILSEVKYLANDKTGLITDQSRQELRDVLRFRSQNRSISPSDVVIATEANAETGLAAKLLASNRERQDACLKFVFTGYVPPNTPASSMLQRGTALWLPWNVHPRMTDNLNMLAETATHHVIPAFASRQAMEQLELLSPTPLDWNRDVLL